ncbi:MAG TPA: hypothetical protein VE129_10350, partial [Thermoanaerobaculia bacterium]|nr:hypothetical protein [Thermoanaerobaculia bacterium]
RDLGAVAALMLASIAKPITTQAVKRIGEQLLNPESTSFRDAVEKVRARREAGKGTAGEPTKPPEARPAGRR